MKKVFVCALIILFLPLFGCSLNKGLEKKIQATAIDVPPEGWSTAYIPVERDGRVLQCLGWFYAAELQKLVCEQGPGASLVLVDNLSNLPNSILAGIGAAALKARAIRHVANVGERVAHEGFLTELERTRIESSGNPRSVTFIEGGRGGESHVDVDAQGGDGGEGGDGGIGVGGDGGDSTSSSGSYAEANAGASVEVDISSTPEYDWK